MICNELYPKKEQKTIQNKETKNSQFERPLLADRYSIIFEERFRHEISNSSSFLSCPRDGKKRSKKGRTTDPEA